MQAVKAEDVDEPVTDRRFRSCYSRKEPSLGRCKRGGYADWRIAEVRMGKGKGAPSHWVAPVRPGRLMFEVDGVSPETAQEALRLGAQKLPVKCKFVVRPDYAQ